jgi:hypothetical protein
VALIKCTPLGGVRRSLQVADAAGLPCVVSSALENSDPEQATWWRDRLRRVRAELI